MTPMCPYHNVMMRPVKLLEGYRQMFHCPICFRVRVISTLKDENGERKQLELWMSAI